MPSGAKKRKAAKRKKELGFRLHSNPRSHRGNGRLDDDGGEDHLTSHTLQETDTVETIDSSQSAISDKAVHILENGHNNGTDGERDSDQKEYVQTVKEFAGDSSCEDVSSEEGSRSVENLLERELPESPPDDVSVIDPLVSSIEQHVSLSEELDRFIESGLIEKSRAGGGCCKECEKPRGGGECRKECENPVSLENEVSSEEGFQSIENPLEKEFPESLPDDVSVIDPSNVSIKKHVSLSEETDRVIESGLIENSMVSEEKMTLLDTLSEKPGAGGECRKECENPVSLENEIASDPPLVRRSSWTNCCGLFALLTDSHK